LPGSGSPLNISAGQVVCRFHPASTLAQLQFQSDIWAARGYSQPQNAAAPINATQQIASASHIAVTFNFRFGAHNGLKSDIAPCLKRANRRHRRLGLK
jgi:hypothetical protein